MGEDWVRPAVAEFVGVFALVFVGVGSMWATRDSGDLLLVALAHGLTIAVMVSATMHISGGHINPAVTIGALVGGQIRPVMALVYIVSQLLGGLVAAVVLSRGVGFTLETMQMGTPQVSSLISPGAAILVEAVLTFFLVFVVFGTAIDERGRKIGGLAIGLTIALDIMMGGPLTGAAMNPARAFGPAAVANLWDNHLVYWVGPLLGAIAAGGLYGFVLLPRAKPPVEEMGGDLAQEQPWEEQRPEA